MLDVSKIASGKISFSFEIFDLSDLIQKIVESSADQFKKSGTFLESEIEKNLILNADSGRIEQLVTNLLQNALKYGNQQPVKIVVQQRQKNVLITVEDSGIGISREHHLKIFDRFERAIQSNNISGLEVFAFFMDCRIFPGNAPI